MPKNAPSVEVNRLFSAAVDTDGPGADTLTECFQALRGTDSEDSKRLDRALIEKCRAQQSAIQVLQNDTSKLKNLVDKLSEEPWQCATLLRMLQAGADGRRRAEVLLGDRRCVVSISPEVSIEELHPGDEVFVNRQGSAILYKEHRTGPPGGVLASFVRWDGGRLVVEMAHEQVLMEALPLLACAGLEAGDILRVDSSQHLAFEKLERHVPRQSAGANLPDITSAQLGGQQQNYRKLKLAMCASLMQRDKAVRYGITGRHTILLIGPPGTGKTLMVRTAAAELQREFGMRCCFEVVKPGELSSMWHGETERNIRVKFANLRRLAEESGGMVVLYLDEVESVGRHRGTGIGHADDKALNALLAEIDGFAERQNICIVSSSNRKELIDPSLLERLSATELTVNRPNAAAAQEIFAIHLPASLPFSPNGSAAPATRQQLIQAGVSRLFAPNAENKVAVIRLTDGKQREVFARELVSGRGIEQICHSTRLRALERDITTGEPGLCVTDVEEACDDAIDKMRSTLSRHNAQAYLPDLPQDVQILAVDAVAPRVARPRRYINPNPNTP